MAEFSFGQALRDFGSRPNPNRDPMDPFAPSSTPTTRALRSVVSPVPHSSIFRSGSRGSLPTLGASGAGSQGPDIVPGPLGTWEHDRGRPHQQVGKFGVNLLGSGQGFAPGEVTPYSQPLDAAAALRQQADPSNPDNRGFIEGLLGAVGGVFGSGGQAVGRAIGSGFDLPFETIGNVAGVLTSRLTGQEQWETGIDADLLDAYRQAERENPINGLLLWGNVAKAQHQRDLASGKRTEHGLMQDIGPAVALTDFIGMALQVGFGVPARGVQRVIGGATIDDENLQRVERAVARGETVTEGEDGIMVSSDPNINSDVYARMQMRLARGDFGAPGSQRARDLMRDAIITEGGLLRDPSDAPQKAGEGLNAFLPFGMTGQGLLDMGTEVVTDPAIIASFGVGAVAKAARMGTMAANAKFWQAIPREGLDDAMKAVERTAMRLGGHSSPDQAWAALGRSNLTGARVRGRGVDEAFESQVYREALNDPAMAPFRPAAEGALNYIERWRSTWEPALRPVAETVRNINDPFRLFGMGGASKAMADVFGAHATEGIIRGQGSLDAHAHVQGLLGQVPGDFLNTYNRGLGVAASFETRVFHRNGLMADLRRRIRNGDRSAFDLMNQYLPDEVLRERMAGSTAGDIATGLEKQALRYRPLYLATERGGGEAALARAREEAAGRLQMMGMGRDEATGLAAQMGRDEISLLDLSYFGHAMDSFVTARGEAMRVGVPKGALNPEELTMLGPRQLTAQMAEQVIDSVSRGAIDEVRAALRRYDILYENLGEQLDDAKLMTAVRELLQDQIDAGALPRDIDNLDGLSEGMRHWAQQNAELGYKVGFRPADDQMWRVTTDADGKVLGINPWVEVSSGASEVGTYTRWQRAKDMMFHAVRGERIMADARVRLAQHTSERWGLARGQSDALFARFLRMAQEAGITPRGLSPEQVFQIVKTHGIDDDIIKGIGVRESVEALLHAFEGQWRHVGLTQKFTGSAKTTLGGQGNWLGQVAEKIYPMVRFTLNPLFQAQEMTEPFILNLMRGIKPGFRPSEMDEKTLQLIEVLIRDSKYAYDDQIEYGATLLWGADSAREAFGANSRLGKLTSRLDILNVKEVKRVNYAKTLRRTLGREFRDAIERVSPDVATKLRAHYQTDDWGEIAVRYLGEKGWVETPVNVLKPEYLGARVPVELDKVARHFPDIAGADELRQAVREGRWDEPMFRDVLASAGADPDFINRAFTTAAAQFSPDEWWDEWRLNFRQGNRSATNADRALFKAVAAVHNMTEAEYLAKHFADVPMSVDERALMALADTEKRWLQFMSESVDTGYGRTQAVDARIENFRSKFAHVADREHFAIFDDNGDILAEGHQWTPWKKDADGSISEAGLGDEVEASLPLAAGRTFVHNHPSHNPFSPADITTAARFDAKEMMVTSPGITYSLRGAEGFGWFTDEFMQTFGVPDKAIPGSVANETTFNAALEETFWLNVRSKIEQMWHEDALKVYHQFEQSPWWKARVGDQWAAYLDAVATNTAVQKMADRFGWKFDTVTDFRLPADDAARHDLLVRMAENPPHYYQDRLPFSYRSEPLVRHEARAGTSVAYEYDTDLAPWLPRTLSDDQQRLVQDEIDDWYRTAVAPRFGVLVTDVRRGRGGWYDVGTGLFSDTINAVQDVFGTREQVRAYASAIGYNAKQWAVFTSRPKIGANVADYSAGEAWSWQYVASRELTDDEAVELQRTIAKASPEVAGWGSSIVRTADGRTAIRYVNGEMEGQVTRQQFHEATEAIAINDAIESALNDLPEYDVQVMADAMDFDRIRNDWDEAPNGETYKAAIAEHRPDVVRELDGGLAVEARDRLAAALRRHAPDEFDAHLTALRERGEPVPDFGVPGEFTPAPLADRLSISIPGGRESLGGLREFSLWEQQLLKAQTIDAGRLYNADPDLYVDLMDAIWKGKFKPLEGVGAPALTTAYNMFEWAALTSNAALDVTEGASALLRANPGHTQGILNLERLTIRAHRIVGGLPERFRRSPAHVGIKFQLDEGIRISGFNVHEANWLGLEDRDLIDRLSSRVNEAMRNTPEEEREALARAITKRLDANVRGRGRATRTQRKGKDVDTSFLDDLADLGLDGMNRRKGVNVQVHPFHTKRVEDHWDNTVIEDFISIGRDKVRFKSTATNTAWGRVLKWLDSEVWTSDNPAVQRFMLIQPDESRSAYALRLSSILPGIDVKTAMMAAQTAGPKMVAHGALDTHIVRYVVQKAMQRGDLEDVLARLSPQYAAHLREEAGRITDDASSAFKSPEADKMFLVPDGKWRGRPWSPEKEAVMRSRLHLIEDPELRALYDDPEVLRLVSETHGKVNRWGGDYAVIEDYFNSTLRMEEVEKLRAAGHHKAADRIERMSGGEWQWFKWDQIRAAAGTPLDPHVSITRGADMLPARVGAELDRNIGVTRLGTPYDPKAMVLQQIDGRILGANQILEDSRRVLLATQHADGRTGLHELAHVFEQHLDPSLRNQVLAEFRKATGSRRRTWSREVSEWWADSLLDYARARGRGKNPGLRSSFDYFRKTLDGIEASIKADQERVVLERQRNSALRKATRQVEKVTPALREADKAAKAAQRRLAQANRELRRVRGRAGLEVLETRAEVLRDGVQQVDQRLKDAKAAVREAMGAAKAADLRAQQAIGTPSAGGLRASASRATRRVEVARQAVTEAESALKRARDQYNKASRKVAGARQRVPVETFEKTRDAAREASEKATRARREAEAKVKAARKALDDAKALPTKPPRARVAPLPLSDEMKAIWDSMTTPAETPSPTTGTGQPYDAQQEAVYQAARHALSRSEEDAFRLHYYKRGRSFVERSVNHPYFGLYPASYMWGKILPEMIRFLTRTPFGLEAPMGGLALSHNIYRGVMTQQQYDPEFREKMAEQTDLWHFAALLTPSLPWEVPVNAPLWARRFADAGLTFNDKMDDLLPGEEPPPLMTVETMGRTGREMLNYAFGPGAAIEQVATAAGLGGGAVEQSVNYVDQTVNSILTQGRTGQPVVTAPEDAMMPAQGLGIPSP